MTRFRRLRVLAGLASLLLLVGMTAYASHHHEDGDHTRSTEHCDLCLQLGAAAGAPAVPVPVLAVDATAYRLPVSAGGVIPARRFLQSLQARAPPESLHG